MQNKPKTTSKIRILDIGESYEFNLEETKYSVIHSTAYRLARDENKEFEQDYKKENNTLIITRIK